ncbi:MAG: carbohydrate ABC transporter permease [Lachnospiraceae bacterium]|nr:carbohydrate ABC transporter permease [Lachnospiraceae bacterium]
MASDTRREHAVEKVGARKIIIYVILVLWALLNLFPVYWMFTFSLKTNEEIFGKNLIGLPWDWKWSNYASAWNTGHMPLYFLNSVVVSVCAIALVIISSMMATYAITRLEWRFSRHVNAFFMLGLTIPIHASIVPIYVTLKNMGLTNTYFALIFPYAAFSLAMGILICTGFMVEIPKELDEAARIDGCGPWKTFGVVILPLMKPAVATISIYSFLQCWNELMFANIFNSDGKYRTLPVGVQQLSGQYTTEWGPIGAALVIATFPMLIVYIFMSKKIQESFVVGAVKG